MRFLCLLSLPLSVLVAATSSFDGSDEDFLDFQPVEQISADIGLPSIFTEDILIDTGPDSDLEFSLLSAASGSSTADVDGWSFDISSSSSSSSSDSDSDPLLFESLELVAFSGDDDSFTNFSLSPDDGFDTSTQDTPDSNLLAATAPGPPSCDSLDRGKTNLPFVLLCCDPACTEDQSWRAKCGRCMKRKPLPFQPRSPPQPRLTYLFISQTNRLNFRRDPNMFTSNNIMLSSLQRKLFFFFTHHLLPTNPSFSLSFSPPPPPPFLFPFSFPLPFSPSIPFTKNPQNRKILSYTTQASTAHKRLTSRS